MRKVVFAAACAGAVAAVAVGGAAAHPGHHERHVSPKGADTGDCTKKPCRTIGYAVGVANAGDRIEVGHGTYAESVLVQKRLELEGHGATVDATGKQNGIVVDGAGAARSEVRGFDVVNAVFEGILVQNTSHVTVAENELSGNDTGFDQDPSPCQGSLDDCGEALHLAA